MSDEMRPKEEIENDVVEALKTDLRPRDPRQHLRTRPDLQRRRARRSQRRGAAHADLADVSRGRLAAAGSGGEGRAGRGRHGVDRRSGLGSAVESRHDVGSGEARAGDDVSDRANGDDECPGSLEIARQALEEAFFRKENERLRARLRAEREHEATREALANEIGLATRRCSIGSSNSASASTPSRRWCWYRS